MINIKDFSDDELLKELVSRFTFLELTYYDDKDEFGGPCVFLSEKKLKHRSSTLDSSIRLNTNRSDSRLYSDIEDRFGL